MDKPDNKQVTQTTDSPRVRENSNELMQIVDDFILKLRNMGFTNQEIRVIIDEELGN